MASRRTRGPIDNISFGAPVWSVTNHSVMFRILRVFRMVWMIWRVLLFQLRRWLFGINDCFRYRYSRSDPSLFEPVFVVKVRSCRTGSNRGCIATSARKLPPWHSPSPTVCCSSQCPRNAKLTMARFITVFRILSKYFRQEVASVAIAWSWTRSMRCPAFHRPMRCSHQVAPGFFHGILIFTPKFFGLHDTLLTHYFCIADG